MEENSLSRRLAAEFAGTAVLLCTVVGSGIMAETLAGGNVAIALLGNTIPTGAIPKGTPAPDARRPPLPGSSGG